MTDVIQSPADRPILYERAQPVQAPLYEKVVADAAEELQAGVERNDDRTFFEDDRKENLFDQTPGRDRRNALEKAVEQVRKNRAVDGDPFWEERLPIPEAANAQVWGELEQRNPTRRAEETRPPSIPGPWLRLQLDARGFGNCHCRALLQASKCNA
jgi:hypothetical protein